MKTTKRGRWGSVEAREKVSQQAKERWKNPLFHARMVESLKGRPVSQETRNKIRQAAINQWRSNPNSGMSGQSHPEERRQRIRDKVRGHTLSAESKARVGAASRVRWREPAFRERMLKSIQFVDRDACLTEEGRRRISEAGKKKWRDSTFRQKMSEMSRSMWQDPIKREQRIKSVLRGMMKRPTSLEERVQKLITSNSLPFKYTGNGEVLIGGKNPDFVNVNGEKLCIEARPKEMCKYWSGCSWEEYAKQRRKHFAEWGWECRVVWAENTDSEILEKLEGGVR